MAKNNKVSLKESFRWRFAPTQSRWGLIQVCTTSCFFLVALAFSVYAIWLSFMAGAKMIPPLWLSILLGGVLGLGLLVGIFTISIAIRWWIKDTEDPATTDMRELKKDINGIKGYLNNISKQLGKIANRKQ